MKTYFIGYNYHGFDWVFEMRADDLEEALGRLAALKDNGLVVGEVQLLVDKNEEPIDKLN